MQPYERTSTGDGVVTGYDTTLRVAVSGARPDVVLIEHSPGDDVTVWLGDRARLSGPREDVAAFLLDVAQTLVAGRT